MKPVVSDGEGLGDAGQFATTHWSVVLQAADTASPQKRVAALGALYQAYFYPLYAFVRRRGNTGHDAQDLLHDFFQVLIEKNYLKDVARERGRFRTFLLAALSHFLANQWRRSQSQKRGGRFTLVSLDQLMEEAEQKFEAAASASHPPAEIGFDLEWARTVLARVMEILRGEFAGSRRGSGQFEVLKVYLSREGSAESYRALAAELGMSEGAVKVAVHRLRRRFQEALRQEIASTVSLAGEVEDELRHLVEVLQNRQ